MPEKIEAKYLAKVWWKKQIVTKLTLFIVT